MSEPVRCEVCMHHCLLSEGQYGRCRARRNVNGRSVAANYGRITSMAMDPIEKKPLLRFHPGTRILSIGSYGCNFSCPFCQNSMISMADQNSVDWCFIDADAMAARVLETPDNLGIAFTYNEPMIDYEYIIDVARRVKDQGKQIVAVTNGSVSLPVWEKTAPYLDALNIDLKGPASFYREIGGSLNAVKDAIAYCHDKCHVEVTTLIIPGKNDDERFIREEAQWLASLDPDIPLILSRYFPRYHYQIPATDPRVIYHLRDIAAEYLNDVYTGNC